MGKNMSIEAKVIQEELDEVIKKIEELDLTFKQENEKIQLSQDELDSLQRIINMLNEQIKILKNEALSNEKNKLAENEKKIILATTKLSNQPREEKYKKKLIDEINKLTQENFKIRTNIEEIKNGSQTTQEIEATNKKIQGFQKEIASSQNEKEKIQEVIKVIRKEKNLLEQQQRKLELELRKIELNENLTEDLPLNDEGKVAKHTMIMFDLEGVEKKLKDSEEQKTQNEDSNTIEKLKDPEEIKEEIKAIATKVENLKNKIYAMAKEKDKLFKINTAQENTTYSIVFSDAKKELESYKEEFIRLQRRNNISKKEIEEWGMDIDFTVKIDPFFTALFKEINAYFNDLGNKIKHKVTTFGQGVTTFFDQNHKKGYTRIPTHQNFSENINKLKNQSHENTDEVENKSKVVNKIETNPKNRQIRIQFSECENKTDEINEDNTTQNSNSPRP